jgi:nitrogenase molybdenum-iron protein alpha/beta subunit
MVDQPEESTRRSEPDAVEREFSPRHLLSFSVGVYLACNAIRDAYLVVDGPDCALMRTQFIQGNHDYLSELTSVAGLHKVVNTALEPARVMNFREDELIGLLTRIGRTEGVGCVLMTSLPLATVIGTDYARLCRRAAVEIAKPVVSIPGRSLATDWLGGYQESLAALAAQLELPERRPSGNAVAVVGLLHDRNEADCRCNVEEVERLLRGLGLDPVSVWLSGRGCAELQAVSNASTIVSLPYGRKAARTLAERLGARLVEAELPFGLAAAERFVRQVAEACDRVPQAEQLIDAELAAVVPPLEWIGPFLFQERSFGFIGDPYLRPGFAELIGLLGGRLDFSVVTACRHHLPEHPACLPGESADVLVEPRVAELLRFFDDRLAPGRLDCLVTNSTCIEAAAGRDFAVVELGFPSYHIHALYDRPYLGFRGALALVDTLANQLRLHLALRGSTRSPIGR